MKKYLKDYIYKSSFLDKQFCNETIAGLQKIKKSNWQEHTFSNPKDKTLIKLSNNNELDILYSNEIKNTEIIMRDLWYQINNYIKNLNFPWFDGWNGYTHIRYNKYIENKKMALHCDHIPSIFDGERKGIPILSCLGVLNDDYEGGEFIMFDDYKIKLKQGDLLIFPSNFMYPHKVDPVKKGTRHSYISWVY
jgi:hypothetical protein